MPYVGARPKQKLAAVLTSQLKPREETIQRRWPCHVPLGSQVSHKLPPKWTKNGVIHRLTGEVKLPPPIKPKIPLEINKLTTTFSNTLNALPTKNRWKNLVQRSHPKTIWLQHSNGSTSSTNVSSLWPEKSNSINYTVGFLRSQTWYIGWWCGTIWMLAESEEQKHLYYQSVHQQGYSDGCAPRIYWKQYKPVNVS